MKKFQLSIPSPCHEDWSKMSGVEKGRFCNSCQKTVVDFTHMSDREIATFFKKPAGSMCGRLHADQLDRDIIIPAKRIPWVKYFFQITIPAFLLTFKLQAQGKIMIRGQVKVEKSTCDKEEMKGYTPAAAGDTIPEKNVQRTVLNTNAHQYLQGVIGGIVNVDPGSKLITGKVTDDAGLPVSGASIKVKGTSTGTVANENGEFRLNAPIPSQLQVSAVGYDTKEINTIDSFTNIVMTAYDVQLSGEVVVVGYIIPRKKAIPVVKKIKDTIVKQKNKVRSALRIYPNPVTVLSAYRIELKSFDQGDYLLELINSAGVVIGTKTMFIDKKEQVMEDQFPSTAAGVYFIKLTHSQTGKVVTERVMVK